MEKVLVTGSSGTVGTRLCEKLLEAGQKTVCVDLKENTWSRGVDKLTLKIDLRNREDVLDKLPSDIDMIIHLAANARVPYAVKNPLLAKDNFEILFNILEFARIKGIKNFMFASSKDVYGNLKTEYSEDDVHIEACESPYAASKIGGEALVHSYHKCFGIDFLIFRITNVYGMYDEPDRLIPIYIRLAKEGKDLVVNGKDKLLDFIYIDDAIDGILLCMKEFEKLKNDTFNIAYGKGTAILEIARTVKGALKSDSKIVLKETKTGDVVKSISDISKAKDKLGYYPKTDMKKGIEKTIKWREKMP